MQNKLTSLNDQLDKYRSTTVTYTFGESTEVLDSQTINSWITIDGENIGIDQEAAKAYIQNLANTIIRSMYRELSILPMEMM